MTFPFPHQDDDPRPAITPTGWVAPDLPRDLGPVPLDSEPTAPSFASVVTGPDVSEPATVPEAASSGRREGTGVPGDGFAPLVDAQLPRTVRLVAYALLVAAGACLAAPVAVWLFAQAWAFVDPAWSARGDAFGAALTASAVVSRFAVVAVVAASVVVGLSAAVEGLGWRRAVRAAVVCLVGVPVRVAVAVTSALR